MQHACMPARQTTKKGALEQLIVQQRNELESKDAEMQGLQRSNRELSEQVDERDVESASIVCSLCCHECRIDARC